MANYHTFKFAQYAGILKFYLDGVQVGANQALTGTLSVSRIAMERTHTVLIRKEL